MLFPTATFAIFFLLVLPLSWLLMPTLRRWRVFMIAASFVFYAWWDWHFVALLAGSIVGNQIAGLLIHKAPDRRTRKAVLAVAVAANLATLGYFKYSDFFVSSAAQTMERLGIAWVPHIVGVTLPVGISFFTFMALSYLIDIYRGDFEPVGFSTFAAYLSFFPHLVAGPIVRPGELIPQMATPRDPRRVDTTRAFALIGGGLFLKVVIANYLASRIVDEVFAAPDRHSSLEVLVGIYAYAVQIFADFAGYTNIAIGVALLLGFKFPQNFNSPYAAVSIQDFWRRWHMTLSRWLRDYLYIPLGGNRKGKARTYLNLMLTMLLGGLWHGASWTFVVWGGIHGTGLVFEHWRRDRRTALGLPEPPDTAARIWARRIVTFNVVCLAWVFFRASSFSDAGAVLRRLFTAWDQPSPLVTTGVLAAIALGIGIQYVPARLGERAMGSFSRLSPVLQGVALGVGLMVVGAMGPEGVAPFIYFRF
ncbi:MAG: MBOAT family O-acyltransferase [Gaiellaceae bacterium]